MNLYIKTRRAFIAGMLFVSFITLPTFSLAAEVTMGEFPEIDRLERELERGVSTKQDVLRVLGKPSGAGRALSGIDGIHRDVWYYEELEASVIETKGSVIRMHAHQQILLTFFRDDVLDGFQWYSNAGAVKGTTPFSSEETDKEED